MYVWRFAEGKVITIIENILLVKISINTFILHTEMNPLKFEELLFLNGEKSPIKNWWIDSFI